MLRVTCCAVALASAIPAAAQTGPSKYWEVTAQGSTKNSCALVRNEDDLESQLTQVGWGGETSIPYIFPPLARAGKAAKIAAVVTADDHFAQIADVSPSVSELSDSTSRLVIHLKRDGNQEKTGVFVVRLDPEYASMTTCVAEYHDVIARSTRSGSSISLNSANNHDVPVTKAVSKEIAEQHLLKRIDPEYPSGSQEKRIAGPVTLRVEISKKGDVTDATLVRGGRTLANSAIDAVKKWKYEPFLDRDGEAIDVHTEVQVFKPKDEGDDDDDK